MAVENCYCPFRYRKPRRYFCFVPRLDIAEGPHATEESPIAVPFLVSNNSYLTIYPQKIICWVYALRTSKGVVVKSLGFVQESNGALKGGDSADFVLKFNPINLAIPEDAFTEAELLIITKYRQQYWPLQLEKRVRFAIRRNSEGRLQYLKSLLTDSDRNLEPTPLVRLQ